MSIAGIHVSNFNGAINWRLAADSISFAYVKATQGTTYTDPRFMQNWKGMQRAGVPRGAYHFFDPRKDPSGQAELFLRRAQMANGDLPPMLDVQWRNGVSPSSTIAGVKTWLRCVTEETGRNPIIHTSASFWKQLGDPHPTSENPLWVEQYRTSNPEVPETWLGWTFWQFTQQGRCAGIEGHVDLTRFAGSNAELRSL